MRFSDDVDMSEDDFVEAARVALDLFYEHFAAEKAFIDYFKCHWAPKLGTKHPSRLCPTSISTSHRRALECMHDAMPCCHVEDVLLDNALCCSQTS